MLILSHFCEIAKFNLILLNLSSDVLDNNLPIVSERILNSNRVIVHQYRDSNRGMVNFQIGQAMLISSHNLL